MTPPRDADWVERDRVAAAVDGPCAEVLRTVAALPMRLNNNHKTGQDAMTDVSAKEARWAEQDRIALAMLIKAADVGGECPSNYVLAYACGVSAANSASVIVARLEQRGLITVQRGSRQRKVTIVATGKSTCEVIQTERDYGHGKKLKPKLSIKDRLAEAVAECGRVNTAAWQLGINAPRRDALWAEIVADLGPQAA